MTTRHGTLALTILLATGLAACSGSEEDVGATDRMDDRSNGVSEPSARSGAVKKSPPSILRVSLDPSEPNLGARVTATVEMKDREADDVRLEYRWSIDGSPIDHPRPDLTLREGARGDEIRVTVVARGAGGQSDPVSDRVWIQNRAPVIRGVGFEPDGEVNVMHPVTASAQGSDPDGDEIVYEYVWRVNGDAVSDEPTLASSLFRRGDEIVLTVVAYDGEDRSDPFVAAPIDVANADPKITSTPSHLKNGEFRYQTKVEDPDGDRALRYHLVQGPEGLSLGNLSGLAYWKPNADQGGRHRIRIRVEDRKGGSDEQAFDLSLTFGEPDSPPAAASP